MDRRMKFAGPNLYYPSNPKNILDWKKDILNKWTPKTTFPTNIFSAVIPHAGIIFSGATAIKTLSLLTIPSTVVIIGVNHTGFGRPLSVWTTGKWETPFGWIEVNNSLADQIIEIDPLMESDYQAHKEEHSIEIILSLLASFTTNFTIVPITMGYQDIQTAQTIGDILFHLQKNEDTLVLASSDMSHYISREKALCDDEKILKQWLSLKWDTAITIAEQENISVCGIGPGSTACYYAMKKKAKKGYLVDHTDSSFVTNDTKAVVSYAGVVFGS